MEDYYRHHEPFVDNHGGLAAVSTTAMAIMNIGSPLVSLAIQRFPRLRRPGGCVGLALILSGMLIAASTSSPTVVLWTQGVMYGIGALMVYFPAMFLIDEWFVERKGLAFGISWAGTGIGGAVTPFLMQSLLHSHGHRFALRVAAGIIVSAPSPHLGNVLIKTGRNRASVCALHEASTPSTRSPPPPTRGSGFC
jgi:MFS family permease